MPQRFVCLGCGYRWESRITPTRCASGCGGSYILPEEQHQELLRRLKNEISENTPFLDKISALKVVLSEFGIIGRPLQTLNLVEGLLKQAQRLEQAEKYISVDHERKRTRGLEDLRK